MFAGKRPTNLGLHDGRLIPCPNTPNCVCSYDSDPTHRIDPIRFSSSPEAAMANLKQIIQSLPRTQIVAEDGDYVYAEFKSQLMGFVDDVEFYLDRAANAIQVRSASRLGKSDLGVNRTRIESIRTQFGGS